MVINYIMRIQQNQFPNHYFHILFLKGISIASGAQKLVLGLNPAMFKNELHFQILIY